MKEASRIPISISVRHVHLSRAHVDLLFGEGYQLNEEAALSQPGQFACSETVTLVGPKDRLEVVRVLGPERKKTQVEISRTDEFTLGMDAPIRGSGRHDNTPGIRMVGPAGTLDLESGVIQAERHIHMSPADAERFGVQDKQYVMVRVGGGRGIVFDDVQVRVSPKYSLEMHLDTDEANAADLGPKAWGEMITDATKIRPDHED